MRAVRVASVAILLAVIYGWATLSFCQAPPSGPAGTPGIGLPGQPGIKLPAIPGMPGAQSPSSTGGAAGPGAAMPKGQDAQWAGRRCLNRGDNSLGTCEDVCRNLGVTRTSDSREYSGICNY